MPKTLDKAINRDGQLVVFSIPSDNPTQLMNFYSELMNTQFTCAFESGKKTYTDWVSAGVKLNIGEKHHPNEKPMMHIAVKNLEDSIEKIASKGGSVYPEIHDMKVAKSILTELHEGYEKYIDHSIEKSDSLGRAAIAKDVDNNLFGIMQLEPWAEKFFSEGKINHNTNFEIDLRMGMCDTFEAAELKLAGDSHTEL